MLLGTWGCGGEDDPVEFESTSNGNGSSQDQPEAGAPTTSTQIPPQGESKIEPWLEAGHYMDWECEDSVSPPRAGGAHGNTRICWNDALVSAADTPYPAGAALVKELYTDDEDLRGYAVNVKVAEGSGAQTWYFYERDGNGGPLADGVAESLCAGCHMNSPNDFVFVRP